MKRTKEQKGITLIALIITIVVLLILATVAISSIQNDGILHYATNAADSWNKAQVNEAATIQNYLDYLDKHSQGEVAVGAPTDIEGVSISGNNFTVKAVGGTNATGYRYSTDGTNWSSIVASGTNYTFENLFTTGTNWTIYARAVNASGESTSKSLKVISFNYEYIPGDGTTRGGNFFVKDGTTWGDFITNNFANQEHHFGVNSDGKVNCNDEGGWCVCDGTKCLIGGVEPSVLPTETIIEGLHYEFH